MSLFVFAKNIIPYHGKMPASLSAPPRNKTKKPRRKPAKALICNGDPGAQYIVCTTFEHQVA